MEVQDDTIYVTGMPEGTTEEVVAEYFGQIGLIKVRAYITAPPHATDWNLCCSRVFRNMILAGMPSIWTIPLLEFKREGCNASFYCLRL